VYGGRYQLRRSDESTGKTHKKGLELEVYDSRHNAYRSVTTLSGGEKFLVALSLAIGLSTVVQAQGHGMQLEAMFVDEGFGSLDRESVNDALEVLQGISRSAGIVGIISHVDQLAETIPSKICITKGKDGSHCTINV
jgi:exonuclease SbcC